MRYDRDLRAARRYRGRGDLLGRGQYGAEYEAPYDGGFHGYGVGYGGGSLRSRGSYQAGQLRSGRNPVDEFEFRWGDGYVGGRGYGGTNYDYEHGYRVGAPQRGTRERMRPAAPEAPQTSPATRGGYAWGEAEAAAGRGRPPGPERWQDRGGYGPEEPYGPAHPGSEQPYGPARYGLGPYYRRLERVRRPDDEIREDVRETLFYDTWVDADRVEVEVDDGIVTLRGTLPDYQEVRYATDDAWDVDGVRGVRSELRVEEPGAGGEAGAGPAAEEPPAGKPRRTARSEEERPVAGEAPEGAKRGRERRAAAGRAGEEPPAEQGGGRRAEETAGKPSGARRTGEREPETSEAREARGAGAGTRGAAAGTPRRGKGGGAAGAAGKGQRQRGGRETEA